MEIIIGLIVLAIFFIVGRELTTWYFKTNELLENQRNIIYLLQKISNSLVQEPEKEEID